MDERFFYGLGGIVLLASLFVLGKQAYAETISKKHVPSSVEKCLSPVSIWPLSKVLRWKDLAQKYGDQFHVDPALVLAIIHVESNGIPNAYRWERHLNDASRGLMQVLYRTAQKLGFTGDKKQLYDPDTNIRLGTQYLAQQISRYGLLAGIAAYNTGRPVYDKRGCFANQNYVNKVMSAFHVYKKEIQGGSHVW